MFFYNNLNKILTITNKNFFHLIPLIFFFILASLLDVVSLGLIAPYVLLLIDPENLNQINFEFLNIVNSNYLIKENSLIFLSLLLIVIFFLKSIAVIFMRFLIMRFAFGNISILQINTISAYQNLDVSSFNMRSSSEFIRNARELAMDCISSLDNSLKIMGEAIIIFIIFLYLSFINFIGLFSITILILLISFLFNFSLKKYTVDLGRKKNFATKNIFKILTDAIKGFKEIKVLNKENFFINDLEQYNKQFYNSHTLAQLIKLTPRYTLEFFIILFLILFVILNSYFVKSQAELISTLSIFALAGLRVIPLASSILNSFIVINYLSPSVERIFEDINNDNKSNEGVAAFDSIRFENISFSYPNNEKQIFKNFNFEIKKNQCIGISGASGSGKTSLIDILIGLNKIEDGKIILNKNQLIEPEKYFLKNVAYLPQDTFIAEDTIISNITLEKKINEIDYNKFDNALKKSFLDQLVNSLPQKYNTKIGENGIRLSGGQYKRIALARAFYFEKNILIFDESTNSLDKESEEKIIKEIESLKGKCTIILISHNKDNLKICDQIFKI